MFIEDKAVADITDTGDDFGPNGGFEAILSAPTLDRDGDVFATNEWKTPLPDKITVDVDHEMSVSGTIGSAKPYIADDGTLRIRASFASTAKAQEVRTLVQEGHIDSVSVACMTDKTLKKAGEPCRELLNAGVVAVPSNREAKILASKAKDADTTKAGARNSKSDQSWIQAAHDATVMAGAGCVEADPDDEDGESDGANKSYVVGKSLTGSVEDLQGRVRAALSTLYGVLGNGWPYLVATFISGDGGTAVYELLDSNNGDVTLSREFTDSDGTITFADDFTPVAVLTTIEPRGATVNTSVDPDQDGDHDIRSATPEQMKQPLLTPEQFEQLLAEVTKASSPSGAGEPHSEAPPAASPADDPAEPPASAAGDAASNAADNAAGAESDVAGELPERLLSMAKTAMSRLQ